MHVNPRFDFPLDGAWFGHLCGALPFSLPLRAPGKTVPTPADRPPRRGLSAFFGFPIFEANQHEWICFASRASAW